MNYDHGGTGVSQTAEAVEERVQRLDTGALTAMVADLWAARGFDVRREDGVVVATDGVEREVVAAMGRDLFGRPPVPDRAVDVVAAPRGGSRARDLATRDGARMLDASDVRGMLWHAVDREQADDLAATHLGAPVAALRPPRSIRVRERAASVAGGVASEPLVTTAVVVLVLVGVLTVTVFGTPDRPAAELLGPDRPTPAPNPIAPAAPGGDAPTDGGEGDGADGNAGDPVDSVDGVPGLSAGGVTNATALAAAHRNALGDESYSLWLDVYAPRNRTPTEPTVQRDVDVLVADDRVLVDTEVGVDEDARDDVSTAYFDGRVWYAEDRSEANRTYHRANDAGSLPVTAVDPEEFAGLAVTRYVATPDGSVTGTVEREGETYYRYVGTGVPESAIRTSVRDYTVVALVAPSGFVVDAEVTYTVQGPTGSYEVTLQWTYGNRGTTTVAEPPWVGEEFDTLAIDPRAGSTPDPAVATD